MRSRRVSWLLMVKSMDISFACSTFSPKNRLKQYTFTNDRSPSEGPRLRKMNPPRIERTERIERIERIEPTLSISLGFSLHTVGHASGRQWLGAWQCVRGAALSLYAFYAWWVYFPQTGALARWWGLAKCHESCGTLLPHVMDTRRYRLASTPLQGSHSGALRLLREPLCMCVQGDYTWSLCVFFYHWITLLEFFCLFRCWFLTKDLSILLWCILCGVISFCSLNKIYCSVYMCDKYLSYVPWHRASGFFTWDELCDTLGLQNLDSRLCVGKSSLSHGVTVVMSWCQQTACKRVAEMHVLRSLFISKSKL